MAEQAVRARRTVTLASPGLVLLASRLLSRLSLHAIAVLLGLLLMLPFA